MTFGYKQDIVNSEEWSDEDWLSFFKDRLQKMRTKREDYDTNWLNYESQVDAKSFYDNFGQLQPNIPLEKTLKEVYMGRTDGKVNFDILPDGQANVEELQPSKYALLFFLDGNGKDTFWKEDIKGREFKSTYGSKIDYTGIRSYKDFRYIQKEGTSIESDTDILNKDNFEKKEHETWFFFPKAIHPRDFYIDDAAYGQPDVQGADDCIMKEKVSALEFETRYKGKANINQKAFNKVGYWTDQDEKNKESSSIDQREIVLFHYFHRITKKYMIIANEEELLFNGLYLYDDGKLPFVNTQHYTNINRFRGEGIPERCAYIKAYRSEIWLDILVGAEMSSGVNFLTGNDEQIGQDWGVGGRGINIWRHSGGAESVQNINTSPNLSYFVSVLDLLDKQVTVDTGINPVEQFDPMTDKVGIKEIMEASKAVRNKSVDSNYNVGLDEALTMMLARIKQFAPALLGKKVEGKNGKDLKTIFPMIKIDDFKVEKEKGKQVFTEDLGKFGYFELKPEVVQGVGVKVVTPSTNSTLPILERQKVNEYITNINVLSQAATFDQTGELMKQLVEFMRFDELLQWMGDAYQYDINGLKANTEKDKIAKENLDKIKVLKENLTLNTTQNDDNLQNNKEGQGLGQNVPGEQGTQIEEGGAVSPQPIIPSQA